MLHMMKSFFAHNLSRRANKNAVASMIHRCNDQLVHQSVPSAILCSFNVIYECHRADMMLCNVSISSKKNLLKQKVVETACAAVSAHPYRSIRIIIRTLNNEIMMVVPPRRRQRGSSMSMASEEREEEEAPLSK